MSADVHVVPLLGVFCGLGTVCAVYAVTRSFGHLPTGVATPPISFLGCEHPEHEVYQAGFVVTGLLLFRCAQVGQIRGQRYLVAWNLCARSACRFHLACAHRFHLAVLQIMHSCGARIFIRRRKRSFPLRPRSQWAAAYSLASASRARG